MRVLAVFLLLVALLGVGCEAPEGAPGDSTPAARSLDPAPLRPAAPQAWPSSVLAIPAGFPDEGADPRLVGASDDGIWVVGTGTVERILRDDTKVPRHQRFVLRLGGDSRTLLFAHNIDIAPRVPLKRGDTLAFRGKYEWNDQGGVVHWTHRDKRDRSAGGWILWKGQNFR